MTSTTLLISCFFEFQWRGRGGGVAACLLFWKGQGKVSGKKVRESCRESSMSKEKEKEGMQWVSLQLPTRPLHNQIIEWSAISVFWWFLCILVFGKGSLTAYMNKTFSSSREIPQSCMPLGVWLWEGNVCLCMIPPVVTPFSSCQDLEVHDRHQQTLQYKWVELRVVVSSTVTCNYVSMCSWHYQQPS